MIETQISRIKVRTGKVWGPGNSGAAKYCPSCLPSPSSGGVIRSNLLSGQGGELEIDLLLF